MDPRLEAIANHEGPAMDRIIAMLADDRKRASEREDELLAYDASNAVLSPTFKPAVAAGQPGGVGVRSLPSYGSEVDWQAHLRGVIDESPAGPRQPARVMDAPLTGLVGKSDANRQAGMKQDEFYQNMLARYGSPDESGRIPGSWSTLSPDMKRNLSAYYFDSDGFRTNMQREVMNTGYLGAGSPLGEGLTWASSLPAVGYAAGQSLANTATHALTGGTTHPEMFPYPKAGEEYRRAISTLVHPIARPLGKYVARNAFDDRWNAHTENQKEIDSIPWYDQGHDYERGGSPAEKARAESGYSTVAAGAMKDGETYFREAGVPDRLAMIIGDLTDSLWNPMLNVGGIGAAAKAGKYGRLAGEMAAEFAPSIAMRAIAQSQKR